jgi:trans-aconitate methyltransferase
MTTRRRMLMEFLHERLPDVRRERVEFLRRSKAARRAAETRRRNAQFRRWQDESAAACAAAAAQARWLPDVRFLLPPEYCVRVMASALKRAGVMA